MRPLPYKALPRFFGRKCIYKNPILLQISSQSKTRVVRNSLNLLPAFQHYSHGFHTSSLLHRCDLNPTDKTGTSLVLQLIEDQDLAEISRQFDNLKNDEITSELLDKVVESTFQTEDSRLSELFVSQLVSRNQLKPAVQLFHKLTKRKITVSQPLYVSLIQAFVKHNDIDGAVTAFFHLKESGQPLSRETYNGIIEAYTNFGDMINAKRIFDEMYKCGFNADVHTYIFMINGYAKRNNAFGISGIYNLLRVDVQIEPNYELYRSLLNAYSQIGDLSMVFRLWDGIAVSDIPLDNPLVSIMFRACGRYGVLPRAQALWRKLHMRNFQFDSESYSAFIVALIQNGLYDPALNIFTSMKSLNMEPTEKYIFSILSAFGEGHSTEKEPFVRVAIEQFPELAKAMSLENPI